MDAHVPQCPQVGGLSLKWLEMKFPVSIARYGGYSGRG